MTRAFAAGAPSGVSGWWLRDGNRIVLLSADRHPPAPAGELEGEFETAPAYTVCDFIHPRIDVEAQYLLFDLAKHGGPARTAALQMLAAVRAGDRGNGPGVLRGIFQANQREPMLRARSLNKGWWELIGSTFARCVPGPAGQPPMIVINASAAKEHRVLGGDLWRAWIHCGLPPLPPPPPSGKVCTRPPPQPPVRPEPGIEVSPKELVFRARSGSKPLYGSFTIRSTGPGVAVWRAGPVPDWIILRAHEGGVTTDGWTMDVNADPRRLQPGRYVASIVVTAGKSQQTLDVDLTVLAR